MVQPFVLPQVAFLDWLRPGWDWHPWLAKEACEQIARRSLAVLMSLAAVILYGLLISLGLRRVALPATLAAALGSQPLDCGQPGDVATRTGSTHGRNAWKVARNPLAISIAGPI